MDSQRNTNLNFFKTQKKENLPENVFFFSSSLENFEVKRSRFPEKKTDFIPCVTDCNLQYTKCTIRNRIHQYFTSKNTLKLFYFEKTVEYRRSNICEADFVLEKKCFCIQCYQRT